MNSTDLKNMIDSKIFFTIVVCFIAITGYEIVKPFLIILHTDDFKGVDNPFFWLSAGLQKI